MPGGNAYCGSSGSQKGFSEMWPPPPPSSSFGITPIKNRHFPSDHHVGSMKMQSEQNLRPASGRMVLQSEQNLRIPETHSTTIVSKRGVQSGMVSEADVPRSMSHFDPRYTAQYPSVQRGRTISPISRTREAAPLPPPVPDASSGSIAIPPPTKISPVPVPQPTFACAGDCQQCSYMVRLNRQLANRVRELENVTPKIEELQDLLVKRTDELQMLKQCEPAKRRSGSPAYNGSQSPNMRGSQRVTVVKFAPQGQSLTPRSRSKVCHQAKDEAKNEEHEKDEAKNEEHEKDVRVLQLELADTVKQIRKVAKENKALNEALSKYDAKSERKSEARKSKMQCEALKIKLTKLEERVTDKGIVKEKWSMSDSKSIEVGELQKELKHLQAYNDKITADLFHLRVEEAHREEDIERLEAAMKEKLTLTDSRKRASSRLSSKVADTDLDGNLADGTREAEVETQIATLNKVHAEQVEKLTLEVTQANDLRDLFQLELEGMKKREKSISGSRNGKQNLSAEIDEMKEQHAAELDLVAERERAMREAFTKELNSSLSKSNASHSMMVAEYKQNAQAMKKALEELAQIQTQRFTRGEDLSFSDHVVEFNRLVSQADSACQKLDAFAVGSESQSNGISASENGQKSEIEEIRANHKSEIEEMQRAFQRDMESKSRVSCTREMDKMRVNHEYEIETIKREADLIKRELRKELEAVQSGKQEELFENHKNDIEVMRHAFQRELDEAKATSVSRAKEMEELHATLDAEMEVLKPEAEHLRAEREKAQIQLEALQEEIDDFKREEAFMQEELNLAKAEAEEMRRLGGIRVDPHEQTDAVRRAMQQKLDEANAKLAASEVDRAEVPWMRSTMITDDVGGLIPQAQLVANHEQEIQDLMETHNREVENYKMRETSVRNKFQKELDELHNCADSRERENEIALEDVEEKLYAAQCEADWLKEEILHWKNLGEELQDEILQCKQSVSSNLWPQKKELDEQKKELDEEKKELDEEKKELDKRWQKLNAPADMPERKTVSKVEEELEELKGECEGLAIEMMDMQAELSRKDSKLHELNDACILKDRELEKLGNEVQETRSARKREINKLRQALEQSKREEQDLRDLRESDVKALRQHDVASNSAILDSLHQQRDELLKQNQELHYEVQHQNTLKRHLAEAQQEVCTLREQDAAAQNSIAAVAEEKVELENKVNMLTEELNILAEDLNDVSEVKHEELKQASEEIEELKQKLESQETDMLRLNELDNLPDEMAELECQVEILERENERLHGIEDESNDVHCQLDLAEQELARLKKEFYENDTLMLLSETQQQLAEKSEEVARLHVVLQSADQYNSRRMAASNEGGGQTNRFGTPFRPARSDVIPKKHDDAMVRDLTNWDSEWLESTISSAFKICDMGSKGYLSFSSGEWKEFLMKLYAAHKLPAPEIPLVVLRGLYDEVKVESGTSHSDGLNLEEAVLFANRVHVMIKNLKPEFEMQKNKAKVGPRRRLDSSSFGA